MGALFSYGYTGGSVEDLKRYAEAGAVILDIRFSPNSRVPKWRQDALKDALGPAYVHVQQLGNRNYRGGPIELADAEHGLGRLQFHLRHRPVVLLCACPVAGQCHRAVVAAMAQERNPGLRVVHLRPGDELDLTMERSD